MENTYIPKKLFLYYWLPFVLWAAVIFLFSASPTGRASEIHWKDFIIKKTAHLIEYSTFTVLLFRALIKSSVNKKKAAIISVIIAMIYAFSDEFHQSFTPGREPKLRDVLIDISGSILTALFIYRIAPKLSGKPKYLLKKLELV
ncbi:MAG TPA: VanZ family protein [Patescibacteria group bacterium]|nr:VanZ family protein [Patescibacteria group bacterium]